ncbi:MAG: MerR family transcriptional regulator, partial [Clostridiales bacterium]|nr:MerR family transcriptional regulator [Clostridiales bacterium]
MLFNKYLLKSISPYLTASYDEIGLLKPSDISTSGYRLYDDEEINRLMQILFFKELGFSLK